MADEVKNPFELPALKEGEKPVTYWLGTLPGCPHYNVSVGGVTFQRYTDPPVGYDVDSMATQRAYQKGSIAHLTESMVEAIYRAIRDKAVRFFGTQGQGQIHAMGSPMYERMAIDQPLAMFLYMVPLTQESVILRMTPGSAYPESMYKMAGGTHEVQIPGKKKASPDIAPEIEDLDKPAVQQHVPPQLAKKGSK